MALQALAVALLAVSPAFSQQGQGARACSWQGYDNAALVKTVNMVFDMVKAGYGLSPEVKLFFIQSDSILTDQLKLPGNTIGAAFPDHWPRNQAATQGILITHHAFEVACNEQQLGFVIAHEFAHLQQNHMRIIADNAKKKYLDWANDHMEAYAPDVPPLKDFLKGHQAELDAFQRPKESEADQIGLAKIREIITKAGGTFDDKDAVSFFKQLGDYDWATGVDASGGDHGTAQERADQALKMSVVLR